MHIILPYVIHIIYDYNILNIMSMKIHISFIFLNNKKFSLKLKSYRSSSIPFYKKLCRFSFNVFNPLKVAFHILCEL